MLDCNLRFLLQHVHTTQDGRSEHYGKKRATCAYLLGRAPERTKRMRSVEKYACIDIDLRQFSCISKIDVRTIQVATHL